jgi:hypothetical protein
MAKPRKALPQRAAMLSAALGTNETPPLVLVVLEPEVAWAPPKPVTGILVAALEPEPVGRTDEVEEIEVLPRYGFCAPQGWSALEGD